MTDWSNNSVLKRAYCSSVELGFPTPTPGSSQQLQFQKIHHPLLMHINSCQCVHVHMHIHVHTHTHIHTIKMWLFSIVLICFLEQCAYCLPQIFIWSLSKSCSVIFKRHIEVLATTSNVSLFEEHLATQNCLTYWYSRLLYTQLHKPRWAHQFLKIITVCGYLI